MNDEELGQSMREFNACIDEAMHYINAKQECFIVRVGAFEIRFELAKLGNHEKKGEEK